MAIIAKLTMQKTLNQGEKLLLLIRRSGMQVKEVADMLDVTPTSLSRMFKSDSLSFKVRRRAASIFDISEEYFSDEPTIETVQEPEVKYTLQPQNNKEIELLKEIQKIKKENARLEEDLIREKQVADDLRKLLKNITGTK